MTAREIHFWPSISDNSRGDHVADGIHPKFLGKSVKIAGEVMPPDSPHGKGAQGGNLIPLPPGYELPNWDAVSELRGGFLVDRPGIAVGAVAQEQLHHLKRILVRVRRRDVQRRGPNRILNVDIGPSLQQQLNHSHIPRANPTVQRRPTQRNQNNRETER